MHDKVDVLIIGSGASRGAVDWSLAETRMRILCLEQGDWVKPTDYPSNGRDAEARQMGAFSSATGHVGNTRTGHMGNSFHALFRVARTGEFRIAGKCPPLRATARVG